MSENWLIAGLAISIMFNVLIVILQIFTGVGADALQRFWRKKLHRRGGYSYSLMATRDGNIVEVFQKVSEEGTFEYNKKDYVREPKLTRPYRGIPANFHREGIPAPIDPWSDDIADFILSCGEMDNVMNAQQDFDIFKWIEQNKSYFLMGAVVLIGVCAVAAYFGYMNYEILRDAPQVAAGVVAAQ